MPMHLQLEPPSLTLDWRLGRDISYYLGRCKYKYSAVSFVDISSNLITESSHSTLDLPTLLEKIFDIHRPT